MRRPAQGIQHQHGRAFDQLFLVGRDGIGIGDVSEVPDAETQYRHFIMEYLHGQKRQIPHLKKLVLFNGVHIYFRDTRVLMLFEHVIELALEGLQGLAGAVYIDGLFSYKIKAPDVVHPGDMVFVAVGENQSVEMLYPATKHLLAEIGTGIDDEVGVVLLNQDRTAEAFVAGIGGVTDFAGTSYDGNALGCACT